MNMEKSLPVPGTVNTGDAQRAPMWVFRTIVTSDSGLS